MDTKDCISVEEEKKLLRKHFKALRAAIPADKKSELDIMLVNNTASIPEFSKSDTLLIYYPLGSEPDLLPLARMARSLGKTVGFPVTDTENHRILFYSVDDLESMQTGAYGIREPQKSCKLITEFDNAFCIVPALSFDLKGNRLGYGGGYYDRFLKDFSGASALLIYTALQSEHIPVGIYDIPVQTIITEKGRAF